MTATRIEIDGLRGLMWRWKEMFQGGRGCRCVENKDGDGRARAEGGIAVLHDL